MSPIKTARPLLAALALLGVVLAGASAAAQTAKNLPAGAQALIGPAKAEGELLIYGIAVNPDENAAFTKAFNAYYGLNAKTRILTGMHPQKAAEVIQQTKQSVPSGIDIFWTAASVSAELDQAGALAKIDWAKEFGVESDLIYGPSGLRAQDGTLVLVAFKTLVPADKAPKTYDDLLNPIYKGRVAMPRTASILAYLAYGIGEDKATSWLTDMMDKQQVRLLATFPDVTARLISGEFAVSFGVGVHLDARQGAPVDNAPVDPVIVTPWSTYVMKDAKNPNLAKLWGYWLTTPEGQKAMDDIRAISRVGAQGTALNKLATGKKVIVVPADWTVKEAPRLTQKYGKIMELVR